MIFLLVKQAFQKLKKEKKKKKELGGPVPFLYAINLPSGRSMVEGITKETNSHISLSADKECLPAPMKEGYRRTQGSDIVMRGRWLRFILDPHMAKGQRTVGYRHFIII